MISEILKAWAAGVVDGEGDIEIKTTGSEKQYLQLWVGITNSDGRMIDTIYDNWGGVIHKKAGSYLLRHSKAKTAKDSYTLYFFKYAECRKFLLDVLPYLITKQDAAIIVLHALITIGDPGDGKRDRGVSEKLKPFYEGFKMVKMQNHPVVSPIARHLE